MEIPVAITVKSDCILNGKQDGPNDLGPKWTNGSGS